MPLFTLQQSYKPVNSSSSDRKQKI